MATSIDQTDFTVIVDETTNNVTVQTAIPSSGGPGTDTTAIHDNVADEILGIAEKTSLVGADLFVIEDSEASGVKKRVVIANLPGGADPNAIHDNVAGEIAAVTEKTLPVNADFLLIEDAAAADVKKHILIGSLPERAGTTDVKTFGAIGDGVADDTSAINAAIAACANDETLLLPDGIYKTTATVDFRFKKLDAQAAAILGDHSDIIVILGNSSTNGNGPTQNIWKVTRVGGVTTTPDIQVLGAKGQHITVDFCDYIQFFADTDDATTSSIAYSTFWLKYCKKIELNTNPSPAGSFVQWINENFFHLNRADHVLIDGTYSHNHNIFSGGSFEGTYDGGASLTPLIDCQVGGSNYFLHVRNEGVLGVIFARDVTDTVVERAWVSGGHRYHHPPSLLVVNDGDMCGVRHAFDTWVGEKLLVGFDFQSLILEDGRYNVAGVENLTINPQNITGPAFTLIYTSPLLPCVQGQAVFDFSLTGWVDGSFTSAQADNVNDQIDYGTERHGYPDNYGPIRLTTTGTLPNGLTVGTPDYWIKVLDKHRIQFLDAYAGSVVSFFDDGSGIATINNPGVRGTVIGFDSTGVEIVRTGSDPTFTPAETTNATDEIDFGAPHQFIDSDGPVRLTTSGTLPDGLKTETDYWINVISADVIQFLDAFDGAVIDLLDDGTGTQTIDILDVSYEGVGARQFGQSGAAVDYQTGRAFYLLNSSVTHIKLELRTGGKGAAFAGFYFLSRGIDLETERELLTAAFPSGGIAVDADAIHDNVASEISAIAVKGTPVGADFLLIEDSAAGNAKKHVLISTLPGAGGPGSDTTAIHEDEAAEISAITVKGTPTAADFLLIEDAAAADAKKHILIGSIPIELVKDLLPRLGGDLDSNSFDILIDSPDAINAPTTKLFLQTGGTNALVIDTAQKVGIGTDSPLVNIHLVGVPATPTIIRLEHDSGAGTSFFEIIDNSATQSIIKKTVLVGAALMDYTPDPLDGSSGATIRMFRTTDTTGIKELQLLRGDNTSTIDVKIATDGGDSYFNGGGDVGIGMSAPLVRLDVEGSSGAVVANFNRIGASGDILSLADDGANVLFLKSQVGVHGVLDAPNGDLIFQTGGVNSLILNSSQDAAFTGDIVAGTWEADNIAATRGGTGIDSSALTGIPSVASGVWSIGAAGGIDPDAIHDNVADEILGITEKTSLVGADLFVIEDSEAAGVKKRVSVTNLPGGPDADAIHDNVADEILGITEKTSLVGADIFLIEDSEAAGVKKRVSVTNLPGGPDADAIHDNVASEISAIAVKGTPVGADFLLIEDSAAANIKKHVLISTLPGAGGPGSDTTAIHEDEAAEISAITVKGTPVNADFLLIEDSAASDAKKHVLIGSLPFSTIDGGDGTDGTAIHDNVAAEISFVTEKITPVDADLILIEDSAAGDAKKRIQIGSLPGEPTATESAQGVMEIATQIEADAGTGTNLAITADKLEGWDGSGNIAEVGNITVGQWNGDDISATRGGTGIDSSALTGIPSVASGVWSIGAAGGIDPDAIHDNVAAEISAVAVKATPVNADFLLIEDSAAADAKKHVLVGSLPYSTIDGGSGTDTTALHDNESAEISAITEKGTPIGADLLVIEDSAAANVKKRVQLSNLPGTGDGGDGTAIHDNVDAEISAVAVKGTPVNADFLLIEDSAATDAKKHILIGSLPFSTIDGGDGTDGTAIHDNVASEISAIAVKGTPIGADFLLIEDSAAANVKKHVLISSLPGAPDTDAVHVNVADEILGITEKGTPVGADLLIIEDSAAAGVKKRIQLTNLPFSEVLDDTAPQLGGDLDANSFDIQLQDGTELLPSLTFGSDPDTGVYNVSADVLGISAGGADQLRASNADGVEIPVDLAVGPVSAADAVIQFNSVAVLKYQIYWDESTSKLVISGDTRDTLKEYLTIDETETVINASARDRDFRVVGDTANVINVDAAIDGLGFYNATPIAQQTGVTVDATAIHAALVALGLITA